MSALSAAQATEIARIMAEASYLDEGEIPAWDICTCDCIPDRDHRRYTGDCLGHNAEDCPDGEYSPEYPDEPGGWSHSWECESQKYAFTREPALDDARGAAWWDNFEKEIVWKHPEWDPNELRMWSIPRHKKYKRQDK